MSTATMNGHALETGLRLLAAGFWPVVIRPGEKRPIGNAWGADRWSEQDLRREFSRHPGAGPGLCLGPGRGPGGSWLIDAEGDGPAFEAGLAELFAGEIPETRGWQSTRGAHRLFIADPARLAPLARRLDGALVADKGGVKAVLKRTARLPDFPADVELRLGGFKADSKTVKQCQSVCPPTPGTDGEPRVWFGPEEVAELPDAFYAALERLASSWEEQQARGVPSGNGKPRRGRLVARDGSRPDRVERASAYLATTDPAISGQGGHNTTFRVAIAVGPGFDLEPEQCLQLLLAEYNPRCQPPWSETELRHKVQDAYQQEARRGWLLEQDAPNWRAERNGRATEGRDGGAHADPDLDQVLARLPRTDLGNAERLVARHGALLRYCHPWQKWLAWDGRRWAVDTTGEPTRLAMATARAMLREAATIEDKDKRKQHTLWAFNCESRAGLSNMLALAGSQPGIPILPEQMDRDPWAFNCLNGTIDLRTGELRPHRQEDLITKLCPVEYDPDAPAPHWLSTLLLFFNREPELLDYWWRLCGYCLAGVVRDHIMPICFGTGANGKSTILGALLDTLGDDYAIKAPPDLLVVRKHEAHPTELADLFGKRLVVALETNAGRRLNEALVKELTGGDTIKARRMREDFWSFRPTHKLMLGTNHKPRISGQDHGIWRRVRLVPFNVKVEGDQADKSMPEKLEAERTGILSYCVAGCLEWQQRGLEAPEIVVKATQEYQGSQDILSTFLAECTEPGGEVKASELFARFKQWAEAGSERPMTSTAFGLAMVERGWERKPKMSGNFYVGLSLRPEDQGGGK